MKTIDHQQPSAPKIPIWQKLFFFITNTLFRKGFYCPPANQWRTVVANWLNRLLALVLKKPFDVRSIAPFIHWCNLRLQYYFPHINLQKIELRDLIRLPIQVFRLLFFKFPSYYSKKHYQHMRVIRDSDTLMDESTKRSRQWLDDFLHLPQKHVPEIKKQVRFLSAHRLWKNAFFRYCLIYVALSLAILCITIPFSHFEQFLFLVALWGIALWARQIPGKTATLLMITLSVMVSSRYIWWRMTSTLNWDDNFDLFLGFGLLSAELYAYIILMLGYFQTAWPLKRTPAIMPKNIDTWPTVDVYIPTYNEPINVVRPTVFAAMGMDWPKDKMNIVILDDGKRPEFAEFAEHVGVGYLTRPDNRHAKAGNLNHALGKTSGEFVTIFDCDHIPTRSFLQIAMGWFLKDKKLALVQTPHHFFSPDPFERNLQKFRDVPNEGELFYGLIQDGNDLWNASFFCGSCAILRRGPLLEVGGIAVETVTEDAHTALKLHSLGYNSAYLNLPQAAGLATESLSAHIGQRIRWARGMAQIFRLDNPLFKKGLKLGQRICYSNAMLHFLYGIPRLVFLTAPLAFLIGHAYTIFAPALSIGLYVLPHIIHANLTNSRMQGDHRNSFWAEMYETVLAWYILRPTTMAIIDPSKGKFNVTEKGGLVSKDYFDWTISVPYLTLVGLNLAGIGFGIWRLYTGPAFEVGTVIINMLWVVYNLFILGGAIAVASEVQQVRIDHRVDFRLPAAILLENGHMYACRMTDYSEGGMGLELHQAGVVKPQQNIRVILRRGSLEYAFPANVTHCRNNFVGLQFDSLTSQQQIDLVQCTFARADAWTSWQEKRAKDEPVKSLIDVLSMGFRGYRKLFENTLNFAPKTRKEIELVGRYLGDYFPKTPKIRKPY